MRASKQIKRLPLCCRLDITGPTTEVLGPECVVNLGRLQSYRSLLVGQCSVGKTPDRKVSKEWIRVTVYGVLLTLFGD